MYEPPFAIASSSVEIKLNPPFDIFLGMVASAVLGAAAGTGMALFVAMTIVVYRYYSHRRKIKEWGSLDRMPFPNTPNRIINKPIYALAQTVSDISINEM